MQTVTLPVVIDPERAAAQGLDYLGNVALFHFPRLGETVEQVHCIAVRLFFGIDEQGLSFMKGTLKASLQLICQRCLKPFCFECICNLAMTPACVGSSFEENDDAMNEYDTIEVNDQGKWHLHQLLEDEILVNLPMVAMHQLDKDCIYANKPLVWGDLPEGDLAECADKEHNTFISLKSLKMNK